MVNRSLNYAPPNCQKSGSCEALTLFALRSHPARDQVSAGARLDSGPEAMPVVSHRRHALKQIRERRPLMHDPFNARPVSGEIMADAAAMTGRPSRTGRGSREDVVEAEFETVHPDVVPFRFGVTPVNAPKGVMLLRSGGRRDRLQSRRGSLAFWAAGMALVAMAFLASGGYAVVGAGTRFRSAANRAEASIPQASRLLRPVPMDMAAAKTAISWGQARIRRKRGAASSFATSWSPLKTERSLFR
jgi:hypothetical protein